jgi:large conductance mechanosensitive channel
VIDRLRDPLADLWAFLTRHTVLELLVAFALASTLVGLADAIVDGLVISPIIERGGDFQGYGPLGFVIAGRVFQAQGILASILVVALIAVAGGVLIRKRGDVLWQEEGEYVECPYCLSEIPARARVCAQCTRDQPRAS